MQNARRWVVWAAILAVGAFVLTVGITHESLWYDESYTGCLVKQGFFDIIGITAKDSHPPLYYLMLRIFTLAFGNTVFTLRFFSVLGALSLAALGPGPVKRAAGANAGIAYSVLVLCFPMTHAMAQEARMYTWAAFFVTGSALYGYLSCREAKMRDAVKFALFSLAAMYTHYYALLAVAVLCLLLLLSLLIGRRKAVPMLLAMGAMLALYTPWMAALLNQAGRVSENFWIPPVTSQVIWHTLTYPFASKFYGLASPNFAGPTFLLSMCLIAYGTFARMRKKESNYGIPFLSLGAFFLTILGGVIASRLIRPVLVERYMVPLMGLLALSLAYAIGGFDSKRHMLLACAAIAGMSLLQIAAIHTERVNGPMTEAVAYLQDRIEPGDVFLHTDEHTLGTFSYYYPDHLNYYYQQGGGAGYSNYDAFKPNGRTISGLEDMEGTPRIWLLQRSGAGDSYQSLNAWQRSGKLSAVSAMQFRLPSSWYAFALFRATLLDSSGKPVSANAGTGTLTVTARGFKNNQGAAAAHLFNKGQMMTLPGYQQKSAEIKNGSAVFAFTGLPFGEYAVFVYHDENKNGQLDKAGGVSAEGFGQSGSGARTVGPPGFDDCKFELYKDMAVDVSVDYFP